MQTKHIKNGSGGGILGTQIKEIFRGKGNIKLLHFYPIWDNIFCFLKMYMLLHISIGFPIKKSEAQYLKKYFEILS